MHIDVLCDRRVSKLVGERLSDTTWPDLFAGSRNSKLSSSQMVEVVTFKFQRVSSCRRFGFLRLSA